MRLSQSLLHKIEWAGVLVSLVLGWDTALRQLSEGSGSDSGTAWLLALAAIATLGATLLIAAQGRHRHLLAALALVLVAVSPTVFAYPINVVVLALAITEVACGVRSRPAAIASR